VAWWTPLGLRVDQPYFKQVAGTPKGGGNLVRVKELQGGGTAAQIEAPFLLQPSTYAAAAADGKIKPNVLKQRNGFPPNFVHSLDSTHMMLTALHMWDAGLTYASVHDCFWTHASTVEDMSVICRDQFVKLHEQQIMDDLGEGFCRDFLEENVQQQNLDPTLKAKAELLFRAVPQRGQLDLEEVKKSIYFFS